MGIGKGNESKREGEWGMVKGERGVERVHGGRRKGERGGMECFRNPWICSVLISFGTIKGLRLDE